MKRFIALFLLTLLPMLVFGQNAHDAEFDTNGPVGDVLFPEDEAGNVVITEVVTASYQVDTLKGLAVEFLNLEDQSDRVSVSNINTGITKITAKVEMKVGSRMWENPAPFAAPIEKPRSVVEFSLIIDFRDGKYKYTLTNFQTDRWRIKGDGEDNGPSNRIHWQRVNSINKDFKRKNTRAEMIAEEEEAYREEYEAVMAFVEKLKSFAVISEDF